jgi:D-alanyl-D-alanine dipeptidase
MTLTPFPQSQLVNVSDFGIQGINFYWTRKERFNLSEEELNAVGVVNEHAYVRQEIIEPLKQTNEHFKTLGYELIVKDAYRSPDLYDLIQKKRYVLHGKEHTDKLLNMVTKPHTNGLTIDVNLIELATGEEVKMRNPAEDPDAFFIDFYRERPEPECKEFQRLQDILVHGMLEVGFKLGSKKEFWHFEYFLPHAE